MMDRQKTRVHVDTETRSTVDLRRTSARVYADDPSTELLVVRWAVNDSPDIREWLPTHGDKTIPEDLLKMMLDPDVEFAAHNDQFERSVFSGAFIKRRHHIPEVPVERWIDTAAKASRQGLPRSLSGVASALGLRIEKDQEGRKLMLKMCKPRKYDDDDQPVWHETQDQVYRLSQYCATDVEVERLVDDTLDELTPREADIRNMTERMNDRGMLLDLKHAGHCVTLSEVVKKKLNAEIKEITKGEVTACSQVHNLKVWCQARGYFLPDDSMEDDVVSIDKNAIVTLLEEQGEDMDPWVKRALEIRMAAARASVSKYQAMIRRAGPDDRVRQYLLYHGAGTGRWSGMGLQPQNFVRKSMADWYEASAEIQLAAKNVISIKTLEKRLGVDPMTAMSRTLRGTIVPTKGNMLVWGDYSQIEARGVAWLAGSKRLVSLFEEGGKVYEDMASQIYGMPIEYIGKDSKERFTGKTAVLGCGYGMGPPKFQWTCGRQGVEIDEHEARAAVYAYRDGNPEVPQLWKSIEGAAKEAVRQPGTEQEMCLWEDGPSVVFYMRKDGFMLMRLPSGRHIYYYNPTLELITTEKFGDRETLMYWTVDSYTRKWKKKSIWGGHLTENAVQGFCRDIMADAMLLAEKTSGGLLAPVLTVHDELVCEAPEAKVDYAVSMMREIMSTRPDWGKTLPLAAEVDFGERYGK